MTWEEAVALPEWKTPQGKRAILEWAEREMPDNPGYRAYLSKGVPVPPKPPRIEDLPIPSPAERLMFNTGIMGQREQATPEQRSAFVLKGAPLPVLPGAKPVPDIESLIPQKQKESRSYDLLLPEEARTDETKVSPFEEYFYHLKGPGFNIAQDIDRWNKASVIITKKPFTEEDFKRLSEMRRVDPDAYTDLLHKVEGQAKLFANTTGLLSKAVTSPLTAGLISTESLMTPQQGALAGEQELPLVKGAGVVGGLATSLLPISGLSKVARAAGVASKALQTGAGFGAYDTARNLVSQGIEGDIKPGEALKQGLISAAGGAVLSKIGGLPTGGLKGAARSAVELGTKTGLSGATGYLDAKLRGLDDPEALKQAAIFGAFHLIGAVPANARRVAEVKAATEESLTRAYEKLGITDARTRAIQELEVGLNSRPLPAQEAPAKGKLEIGGVTGKARELDAEGKLGELSRDRPLRIDEWMQNPTTETLEAKNYREYDSAHQKKMYNHAEKAVRIGNRIEEGISTPEENAEFYELLKAWENDGTSGARAQNARKLFNKKIESVSPEFMRVRKFVQAKMEQSSADAREATDELHRRIKGIADREGISIQDAEKKFWNTPGDVTDYYRKFVKGSFGEWVNIVRYNAMLSSVKTQIINVVGNAYMAGVDRPLKLATNGMVDWIASVFNPSRERTHFVGSAGAYRREWYNVKNMKESLSKAWKAATYQSWGPETEIPNLRVARSAGGKVAESILRFPTDLMRFQDVFFRELTARAETAAKRVPIYAKRYKSQTEKLADLISMKPEGRAESSKTLFQQPFGEEGLGAVNSAVESAADLLQLARTSKDNTLRVIAQAFTPFIRYPTHAFKSILSRVPGLGALNLIGSKDKIDVVSEQLLGSVSTGLVASLLWSSGRMNWQKPKNEDEAFYFDAAGKLPYSIEFDTKGGGRFSLQYSFLPPQLAGPMALVGAFNNAVREKRITQSVADVAVEGFLSGWRFFFDQSYMRSMGDMIASISGNSRVSVPKMASGFVQQVIPYRALIGNINRLLDGYIRRPDKDGSFAKRMAQNIMAQIPGLSQNVPKVEERFTQETIEQPLSDRLASTLLPVNVRTVDRDKELEYDVIREYRVYDRVHSDMMDYLVKNADMVLRVGENKATPMEIEQVRSNVGRAGEMLRGEAPNFVHLNPNEYITNFNASYVGALNAYLRVVRGMEANGVPPYTAKMEARKVLSSILNPLKLMVTAPRQATNVVRKWQGEQEAGQ